MKKIMFICSGNTCRSPLAEGLFKKYLKENNITDIEVGSAGVGAFPGDCVSINSILVAGNRGVDISEHRARNINPEHLLTTDLFFCMSDSHKQVLLRHCDENKIVVLNVPDPYGRPIEIYEECAKMLESQFPQILERIQDTITVREVTESDIKDIAELEKECFSEPWSENSLRDELTNETARFYVLRDGENLLGYIGANNICNEVYITNVAVNSKYRGKGYGKILVNHLIKQSEAERAFFITLEVRKSNENAINLYEKCGFKLIGERKNFYSKPVEDALIYTYYIEE
ncbi:MAG: ribosomal protein S18-alanine N-acetyltransferase [Clostridia bacterium]|nr:ribosomal protein S18-alanine N-acetyltransferase [Clostridia bacterium]